MDILNKFLQAEVNSKEYYGSITNFIKLYEIRKGEFEGNKSDKVKAVIYKNASSYKKIVGYCGNGSGIVGCPDNVETYIMDDYGTTR